MWKTTAGTWTVPSAEMIGGATAYIAIPAGVTTPVLRAGGCPG
ncbi:MAG TPA: hypothetical protein VF188_12985 [Longimicrobiales bacterium]